MNRLGHLFTTFFAISISVTSFTSDVFAQNTPQNQAPEGTSVTFSSQDLLSAMTPEKRKEFLKIREKLRQLKKAKDDGGLDPAVREASAMLYQTTGKEFEKEFGMYRGFNGKTVTAYGKPPPTGRDIVKIVVAGRTPNSRGGLLLSHWNRDESGAIVGSDTRPVTKTTNNRDYGVPLPVPDNFEMPDVLRLKGNGCTHGLYGIPDDTPACRAAMRR